MNKLSAFIITKNDAYTIERAINSVKDIAGEVLVVDRGSVDNTVQIAKSLGVKVISSEYNRYIKQKSYAESLCKNNWIINIESDEELSRELQDEIKFIFGSKFQDHYLAYKMKVVTLHFKDTKPRYMAPLSKFVKIYNKQYCNYTNTMGSNKKNSVSFNKEVNPKIYLLNGITYRRLRSSIDQMLDQENFHSWEPDQDTKNSKCRISAWRVAFEFPFCFLKIFFKKRYFVFGFDGFIYSMIFSFVKFFEIAKSRDNQMQEEFNN